MEPNFQAPINASKNNQIWATCDKCGDLFESVEGGIICKECGKAKCNECTTCLEDELGRCEPCIVKKFKEMEKNNNVKSS